MHALKMLHQILNKSCPEIHAYRLSALMSVVDALVYGQKLTVTGLGRSLLREIGMKHAIKQSDRLIGNNHLSHERRHVYQAVTQTLVSRNKRPLIIVDWSDYTHDRGYLILRASIPVGGRALTLYEEVHPQKCYGNTRLQNSFLKTLRSLLPAECCPIIITDAGFLGPWFRAVEQLGWQYLGRIPPHLLYRKNPEGEWIKCKTLYHQATAKPCYHGAIELVRSDPLKCHLYLYKQRRKGRHKITKYGRRALSKHSKKNALREQSPWLLVTSLENNDLAAKPVIRLYRTRMQIEEAFRDIKNQRTGFSLVETRTRLPERLANLLLVGMLATFTIWLVGRLAEERQWHYQFQANTVRTQRVLSLFYLGCQILLQGQINFTQQEIKQAIQLVRRDILQQW